MRWSVESILAIRSRIARLTGVTADEVYPVIRLRDRALLRAYVHGRGWVCA